MKVGVYLGNLLPTKGGSYTFQAEMGEALLAFASKSQHSFVIFGHKTPPNPPNGNIEFVSIKPTAAERITYRLAKAAHFIQPKRGRGKPKFPTYSQTVIRKSGVQVMWYGVPTCLDPDIPYLLTIWDIQHREQSYFPEVSANGVWENREKLYTPIIRRAARIVTGTQTGKDEIAFFYQVPAERIRVIPFPTPQFALEAQQPRDLGALGHTLSSKGYLLYPAQFWPHKNHANLLYALRLLRDRWAISLPIVFTGSDKGSYRYIRNLAEELGLSSQVVWAGFVAQEELITLYQHALALVFPTFFGPDNLPPLEAFAFGCPVAASRVQGATEQLGDAALLFDPLKPEEIALAIKSLYEDPNLRQTLIEHGMERAKQWDRGSYVRAIFAILDEFSAIRRCWE